MAPRKSAKPSAKPPAKTRAKAKKAPARKAKAKTKIKKPPPRIAKKVVSTSWRFSCKSLGEIRAAIDSLDDVIVPLLCRRHFFVTQAAKFKPSVKGVVIQSRVEEVVDRARYLAEKAGVDPDTMEAVYRPLIDAYTADEQRNWRKLNRGS